MTEADVARDAALVVFATSGAACALAGWRWWQVAPTPRAYLVLRVAQVVVGVQAILAGVLAAVGYEPDDDLYWLYALLPVAIGLIAEQLRIAAAEQVLENRGLSSAQEVGELAPDQQHSVVLAIMRRELGVLAAAAGTVTFLALRAALVV